jgi:lipopolysaccharide/colanic/teichoic acid biosynthesis glycosyltransferase
LRQTEQSWEAVAVSASAIAGNYGALKRVIDVIGASILILFLAPALLISLTLVWLDSGRPLIHRRRVLGQGATPFEAFKVRSMVVEADRILGEDETLHGRYLASNKIADDPRVTRSGRWLRRLSLDEVPQLFNVLRGEMSLVGPRMITAGELPEWGETADLMVKVRPGLTGLWQVSGRQDLRKSDRIRLDGDYVRQMSLLLDLIILARTLPAVLSRRGAY